MQPDSIAELINAEKFPAAVKHLAQSFISTHETSSRISMLFATQQRWLLCHLALGNYYRDTQAGASGTTRRRLSQLVVENDVASYNTFQAFFDEALKYDIIHPVDSAGSAHDVLFEPAPAVVFVLAHWYRIHFEALDLVDGGSRVEQFVADPPNMLARIQPIMADALLSNPEVRVPGSLYTVFTWVNAGGLLMDRFIAGVDYEQLFEPDKFFTNVTAIGKLAQSVGLSRAHTSRTLSSAELLGGLGWTGQRGHSPIWISRGFYDEYARAQAHKLAIFDRALDQAASAIEPPDRSC